jgi:hypothetical protein
MRTLANALRTLANNFLAKFFDLKTLSQAVPKRQNVDIFRTLHISHKKNLRNLRLKYISKIQSGA